MSSGLIYSPPQPPTSQGAEVPEDITSSFSSEGLALAGPVRIA